MSAMTLLAGALVVVGLVGVVVPVLPGSPLVGAGVLVWALGARTAGAWVSLGIVLVLLGGGKVLSWTMAGRSVMTAGVPRRSLVVGLIGAVVGVFVVPVIGLALGGVVGLYAAEVVRLGPGKESWRSTLTATRAIAIAIGVELAAALAATVVWVAAVLAT